MIFRDQMLVCDQCGETFFFTVTQQRRMAEELGHQEIEAPRLCPKCRQPEAAPVAAREVSVEPEPEEQAFEPERRVRKPAAKPERAFAPEPESAPDWDLDEEAEEESKQAEKVLPVFGESLLQEFGVKIKLIGNVKWFSRKKGFGFVTKADGEELFFHRSDVQETDLRQLVDGAQVEFRVRQTDKGLEAFDVSILPTS